MACGQSVQRDKTSSGTKHPLDKMSRGTKHPQSGCPVWVVLLWMSCPSDLPDSPVLAVMFCLFCSSCPILAVLFWLSHSGCPVLAVWFLISCASCYVLTILACCPLLSVLPGCLILEVLCWQPCPSICGIPIVLPVLSFLSHFDSLIWLSCSSCLVLAVLFWLSYPSSPVLAALSL
jgi:hypothetical protein